jgi:hypothetical protein
MGARSLEKPPSTPGNILQKMHQSGLIPVDGPPKLGSNDRRDPDAALARARALLLDR